ncbi:MAG: hypothetical protein QXH27_02585 [Candidatus Micrarchaeia archaeon]
MNGLKRPPQNHTAGGEPGGERRKVIPLPFRPRIIKREPDIFKINGDKLHSRDPRDVEDALTFFWQIGEIGNQDSLKKASRHLPAIRRIFKHAEDADLRVKALQVLGALRDYELVGLVKKLLDKEPKGTPLADTFAWFLDQIAEDVKKRVLPGFYGKD